MRWLSLHDTKRLEEHVVTETSMTITSAGLNNSSARLLPAGTVALSRTATVGKCVLLGRRMATSQDFACYVCGPSLHNKYLLHLFRHMQPVWAVLGGGSTHKTVYMPVFENLQSLLPPLPEQRRIAEILDSLDEAIRKSERVIAKLEQMKQGLLNDLLIRGVDEHGELRDPERHPEQFKDSPLGRIPRGWEVVRFGECLSGSPQNGLYKPSSYYGVSGTPIVRIDGFYDGVLAPVSAMKRLRLADQELKTYRLEPGNILVNRVNSIDFVGKAALVPELPEPLIFESNMMRCHLLTDRLVPRFAIRWLTSYLARRWFHRRAKSAIAQASVNQGDVTGLRVVLPEPDEQERVVAAVESVEQRVDSESEQLAKLRTLKHGLMDDLLTGRVRVFASEEGKP